MLAIFFLKGGTKQRLLVNNLHDGIKLVYCVCSMQNIKYLLSKQKHCLAALLVVFASLSCTQKVQKGQAQQNLVKPVERDLAQIKESGKIVALVGNSSSSYFIYRGRPMGFEYEILEQMAQDLQLDLEVVIPKDMNDLLLQLNRGDGDIIAAGLTVTKERAEVVDFTDYLLTTRQVLIQRKPDGYETMPWHKIRKGLVRNQLDLIGKTIYVRRNSAYYSRLQSLSDEIGGDIDIKTVSGAVETEELIRKVAQGTIDYTVADEHLAQLNATYFLNIDVKLPISFPQRLAWAVRKNSPQLEKAINNWLVKFKKSSDYYHIRKKYYQNRKAFMLRRGSGYHSMYGGKISIYDDLFKKAGDKIGWDWRLLASLAYQESKFNHELKSWAGARGLMQLMPETASRFGGDTSNLTPAQSVMAASNYLSWLEKFWKKKVVDADERRKFVLASYNAGQGHVLDAQRLTEKYGNDPQNWESVAFFLLNKSHRRFYGDAVVKHGYCRGSEPVNYVKQILNRYAQYQDLIPLAVN